MEPSRAPAPDELVAGPDDGPDPAAARRRWWLVAAGAVLVLLLSGRLPGLGGDDGPGPGPAPTGSPSASGATDATGSAGTPSSAGSRPLAGVDWGPARGDLVADDDFVAAAMTRIQQERPSATRLYCAGRLRDGSSLVLAGSDVLRGVVATAVHALYLPRGQRVAQAGLYDVEPLVDGQQLLAWAVRGAGGRVQLVLLTRPGPVTVSLSTRVEFDSELGLPVRRWRSSTVEDGVAVLDLGRDTDPTIGVRARGRGVFVLPQAVTVRSLTPRPSLLFVSGLGEGDYRGPDPTQVTRALYQQAGALAELADAQLRLLWSGRPVGVPLALVLVTRPDGQRFQAMVGASDGQGFPAGLRALAPSAPDNTPWLLEPRSSRWPTLLICPGAESGSVRYDSVRADPVELPADDRGVVALAEPSGVAPSAYGAQVLVRGPDGRRLLKTVLPGRGWDDAVGLAL